VTLRDHPRPNRDLPPRAAAREDAAATLATHLDLHLDNRCWRGPGVTADCEREAPGVGRLVELARMLSSVPIPPPQNHGRSRAILITTLAEMRGRDT